MSGTEWCSLSVELRYIITHLAWCRVITYSCIQYIGKNHETMLQKNFPVFGTFVYLSICRLLCICFCWKLIPRCIGWTLRKHKYLIQRERSEVKRRQTKGRMDSVKLLWVFTLNIAEGGNFEDEWAPGVYLLFPYVSTNSLRHSPASLSSVGWAVVILVLNSS